MRRLPNLVLAALGSARVRTASHGVEVFSGLKRSIAQSAQPLSLVCRCLCGAVIAWAAWGGSVASLVALPFIVWLWSTSASRAQAFALLSTYYLVAARGLLFGGAVFFGDESGNLAWGMGLLVWVLPALVMAAVWALFWGRTYPALRAALVLTLLAVPPIGFIGWAHPITAAGALFPRFGWLGVGATFVLLCTLASPKFRAIAAITASIMSLTFNLVAPAIAPSNDFVAVETSFGQGRFDGDDYLQMRRLQEAVSRASAHAPRGALIVTPELVAGDWSLNEMWWNEIEAVLVARDQTALIGARKSIRGTQRYENGIYSLGSSRLATYTERVPVPIGMWRPWAERSAVASPMGHGTLQVGARTVGALICYEQLLVYPALLSFANGAELLVAPANVWWATATNIPSIQIQAVKAWGRAFDTPVVFAANR